MFVNARFWGAPRGGEYLFLVGSAMAALLGLNRYLHASFLVALLLPCVAIIGPWVSIYPVGFPSWDRCKSWEWKWLVMAAFCACFRGANMGERADSIHLELEPNSHLTSSPGAVKKV